VWAYFCVFYHIPLVFVPVSVFVTIALYYNLKSGIVIPPALLFLLRIASAVQGLLYFHMNFRIVFSTFCEECHWNFDEDRKEFVYHIW
jgi:hypothetical protein